MKKKQQKQLIFWVILVFLVSLSGATPTPKPPACRYVTEAELIFFLPSQQQTLRYTDSSKLSSLLTCLRLATPYAQVTSAEANPDAHHYRITLYYSDNTHNTYHLQDYRYFSKDGKTWQKVRPEKAYYFYLLTQLLPSDRS